MARRILFVPYIDPFIWIYLFLTGQLRHQVWCFQSAFVPELLFKRIPIEHMTLENFMAVGSDATDFLRELPTQMEHDDPIEIKGYRVPIWMLNLKERARFVTNIFHAMEVLSSLNFGRPKGWSCFYLTSPVMDQVSLSHLGTMFENRTGFAQKKSIFLEYIHPFLVQMVAVLFVVAGLFRHWRKPGFQFGDATHPRVLFLEVSAADSHPDPSEYLSSAFLIDDSVISKRDIVFVVSDKATRAIWRKHGYNVVASITKLAGRPRIVDVITLFLGRHLRHFSFVHPTSFKDPFQILCSLKAIESGKVTSLIYSNSYFGSVPAAALSFRALKKSITMIWYSASMYNGHEFAYLLADQVMVWNKLMKDFVDSHPQHEDTFIEVVGPLMYANDECVLQRLNQKSKHKKVYGRRMIGIYAVQPKPRNIIQAARITTNYDEAFYRGFMRDVGGLVAAFDNVVLKSKAKRSTESDFDLSIFNIQSEPANKNPYESIAECDVVICMPFTSIYYAALQLGVPAIFYTPENNVFGSLKELQDLLVVGAENLHIAVGEMLTGASKYPKISAETQALLVPKPMKSTTSLVRQVIAMRHF